MKTTILKTLSTTVTCIALTSLLVGCGAGSSSKNKVSSNNNNYNQNVGPSSPGSIDTAFGVNCNQNTSQTGSRYTGNRLASNFTYHIANPGYSHTSISGSLSPGPLPASGTVKDYIGSSIYGDSIVVSKVTNGSQVLGYNVVIYFCELISSMNVPLISDQRTPQNIQLISSINLDDNPNCGYGSVDSANISAWAPQIQSSTGGTLQGFTFGTSFFRGRCNNGQLYSPYY